MYDERRSVKMVRLKLISRGKLEGIPKEIKIRPFRMLQHKRIATTTTKYFEEAFTEALDESIEYDDGLPFVSSDLFTEQDRRYLLLWQIINSKGIEYSFHFDCKGNVARQVGDHIEYGSGCGAEAQEHVQDLSKLKITPLPDEYKDGLQVQVSSGHVLSLAIPRHRDIRMAEDYVTEWRQFHSDRFIKGYIERARQKFLMVKQDIPDAEKLADANLGVWNTEAESAFSEYAETNEDFNVQLEYLLESISVMVYVSCIDGECVSFPERMKFFDEELLPKDVALINAFDGSIKDYGVSSLVEVKCTQCGGVRSVRVPFRRDVFFPGVARKDDFEKAVAAIILCRHQHGEIGSDGGKGV